MLLDDLMHAFAQIEDFLAVQRPLSPARLGPVICLQEAAGLGESERAYLAERLARADGTLDTTAGAVTLGLLIGLLAAQSAQLQASVAPR